MSMRLGDEDERDDGGDISEGESIYSVLCAALTQATDAQRMEIAGALMQGIDQKGEPKVAFASLSEGTQELFEASGEALFEDDHDIGEEFDDEGPPDEDEG